LDTPGAYCGSLPNNNDHSVRLAHYAVSRKLELSPW
jgi:hypothetical protein